MNAAIAGLDLPKLEATHKLNRVLTSVLGQTMPAKKSGIETALWGAHCFNLEHCSLFTQATEQEQQKILQFAGQALLVESYAIERAGIGYMAKMTLLAETTEERMLYSLFGADETMHLAQLMPFIQTDLLGANDPFLQLLAAFLETADRSALMFVIQVVLEGWGLSHYRTLSKDCQQSALGDLFRSFLQAEARHHGAGVLLFDRQALSDQSRQLIVETLAAFLQMVQVGPQRLVRAIAQVKGDLSRPQRIRLLSELDTEKHSRERLALLRSLIAPIAPDIAETLDNTDLFSPLSPAQCA